jgi:hypothetical protein
MAGQVAGRRQAETDGRIFFARDLGSGKGAFDERKGFIGQIHLLVYHPKMGGYPNLFNHLFGVLTFRGNSEHKFLGVGPYAAWRPAKAPSS